MVQLTAPSPPGWTVGQLTAVPHLRTRRTQLRTPELVLSRFSGGDPASLVVARIPAPPADDACTFRSEFDAILADNSSIQSSIKSLGNRTEYWRQRGLLDDRIKVRDGGRGWDGVEGGDGGDGEESRVFIQGVQGIRSFLIGAEIGTGKHAILTEVR